MGLSPMTKAKLKEVLITSFPIFELLQIRIEGQRYPHRRISRQRVDFFDSKEHAEEAMHTCIELLKRNYEGGRCCIDNCFGFFVLEHLVLNRHCSFYLNERPRRCFSFTADGEPNDCVALDEFGWYRGRKNEDIRFKIGDIVEVVDGDFADLAIVGGLPLTADNYRQMEDDPEECEHPSQFLDESDDCYLVYLLGKTGTHIHPFCYKVFRPTHPLPETVAAKLKQILEDVKKGKGLD